MPKMETDRLGSFSNSLEIYKLYELKDRLRLRGGKQQAGGD